MLRSSAGAWVTCGVGMPPLTVTSFSSFSSGVWSGWFCFHCWLGGVIGLLFVLWGLVWGYGGWVRVGGIGSNMGGVGQGRGGVNFLGLLFFLFCGKKK